MNLNMKSKMRMPTSAALCLLTISLGTGLAQQVPVATPRPAATPPPPRAAAAPMSAEASAALARRYGLEGRGAPGAPAYAPQPAPPVVLGPDGNPLPLAPAPPWKDENWPEPPITLTNVHFDGLTVGQVVLTLREAFKGSFDFLLPTGANNGFDPSGVLITLHLNNVTASEVFNAMNFVFENDRTPVRWELIMNGKRPMAMLRVLTSVTPPTASQPKSMIFFVGDLIGDKKSGGMSLEQIVDAITWVCKETSIPRPEVKFHKDAQLVVVFGSPEAIGFVEQTLAALRQKVELSSRSQMRSSEDKPKRESEPVAGHR